MLTAEQYMVGRSERAVMAARCDIPADVPVYALRQPYEIDPDKYTGVWYGLRDMDAHWLMEAVDAMVEAQERIYRLCMGIRPQEYPYVMPFDPGDAFRLQPDNRWRAVVMYGEFPVMVPGGKEEEHEENIQGIQDL